MLEYVKPFYLHTDAFIAAYGILDSVLTSRRRKNANARSFPEILKSVSGYVRVAPWKKSVKTGSF